MTSTTRSDVDLSVDEEAVVAFTQELVRIRSVNDPGHGGGEAPAAELVADADARPAAGTRRSRRSRPGGPTSWPCVDGGGGPGPTLMFEGHTDVVTEGDLAAWTVDPYGAEIRDGRLLRPGQRGHEVRCRRDDLRRQGRPGRRPVPRPHRRRRARRRGGADARRQALRPHAAGGRGRRGHRLRARGGRDLRGGQGRRTPADRPDRRRWPTARCRSTPATRCPWPPAIITGLRAAAAGGCRTSTASTSTSAGPT